MIKYFFNPVTCKDGAQLFTVNTVFKMATSTHAPLPTYPEESGILPDTCRIRTDGQIRFESGYVWTWKFLNPEGKSYGFIIMRIRMDGATESPMQTMSCGIPKGSTLGPLLFLIYINDLPNCSVDDTNVFAPANNLS